ncbi:cupin domain-containing protein [Flavobacteriaceae bacterium KMM 6897]|nr:cupin domain-containing protein [Flavobacteriaceae bacterium KMM 6897]MEB8345407.1 cupin domain-containing protein [Flavobacteriaceae bacterium KMM 6898]
MPDSEFEKLIPFNLVKDLPYTSNAIVVKHVLKDKSGFIQAMAFDFGKVHKGDFSPFPTYIQIIEGKAELVIEDQPTYLHKGDSIIIPPNTDHSFEANQQFKLIRIVLKSGREDLVQ